MQAEDIIRLKEQTSTAERQLALENRQQVLLKELNSVLKRITVSATPASNNLLSCLIKMAKKG